jgi:hypothetical protein
MGSNQAVSASGINIDLNALTSVSAVSPADLIDLEESFGLGSTNPVSVRWAFRGQSRAFGTLAPSFQRIFRQKRSIGAAEIIEGDLIKTFRLHYSGLPGRTADMPRPEFIDDRYNIRCLSVMQHYGVPTRLLDWTSDFWTAVYFACAGDPSEEAELWMYDRNIFASLTAGAPQYASLLQATTPGILPPPEPALLRSRGLNTVVEVDPKITPRMREQFAHHTLSTDIFADHAPLLHQIAANERLDGSPPNFRRVVISAGCKEKTLRFLEEQRNVTAGTSFPDVEGLGKFLHWHLESLVTTLL